MFRGVAFAGEDLVFHIFALLVANLQRTAIRSNDIDFELTVSTVEFGVGGTVRNGVLVADVLADIAESVDHIACEPRLIVAAAGQLGEGLHLVIGLQPIDAAHAQTGHAMGGSSTTMSLAVIAKVPADAH